MSNSKTCRTVWLAITALAIANLTGWDSASAVSIMLGGAALLYASLRRDAGTVRIQRLTAFFALSLLGEFAQLAAVAWVQLAAATMLLATGCLPTKNGSRYRLRALEVVGVS